MSGKKRKACDLKVRMDTELALVRAKQTMVSKVNEMIKTEVNLKVIEALERALFAAFEAFDEAPPPPFDEHK